MVEGCPAPSNRQQGLASWRCRQPQRPRV